MIIKTQVAQTAAGWLHRKWKVQPLVSFTAADSDISRHFNDRIDPKVTQIAGVEIQTTDDANEGGKLSR